MNKKQVEVLWREQVDQYNLGNDRPAMREAWNNLVDFLVKSGEVTEKQADAWRHPREIRS